MHSAKCTNCGESLRLSDHECRVTPVSGHCQHYLDLTPANCGECANDRDRAELMRLRAEVAELSGWRDLAKQVMSDLERYYNGEENTVQDAARRVELGLKIKSANGDSGHG